MLDYKISGGIVCVECLKRCEMFNPLSDEEMDFLHKNRYEAHFKAGEVIFKQGSPLSHIVSFSKGLAKVYKETGNQRDVIISIIKPGNMIGGSFLYYDRRHQFSFSALIDSLVCFIEVKAFQEIIKKNNHFAESYMHDASQKHIQLLNRFQNVTIKQSHGRMAEMLLYLSEEIFYADNYDIILSRQELADFTGMSKEGTIRILKEFKNDGLIDFQNQNFVILDKKRLQEISQNG
jgi:CRP/FNR family transcriptional regulator, polysaccharide utilization system transcription regulator